MPSWCRQRGLYGAFAEGVKEKEKSSTKVQLGLPSALTPERTYRLRVCVDNKTHTVGVNGVNVSQNLAQLFSFHRLPTLTIWTVFGVSTHLFVNVPANRLVLKGLGALTHHFVHVCQRVHVYLCHL